jgi:dTDP-4-dehydrorhamnose reductase
MVTGASGQLGGHVLRCLARTVPSCDILAVAGRGAVVEVGTDVRRVDLGNPPAVRACADAYRPTHILHLGGITTVSEAYADPPRAQRINVDGTRALAVAAAELDARLLYSSTDMVFGGTKAPYHETDQPDPVSVYGHTKAEAEQVVAAHANTLVARLPLMYGLPGTDRQTPFARQVDALRRGEPLRLFTDEFRTPAWLGDVAEALIALARSSMIGVVHVAGPIRLSRYEMGERIARALGIERPNLVATLQGTVPTPEPRPPDLSLAMERLPTAFPRLRPGPIRAEVFANDA